LFFFIFLADSGAHLREQKSIKKHQLRPMIQVEAIKAKLCSNRCTHAMGYEAHFINLRKNGTQRS